MSSLLQKALQTATITAGKCNALTHIAKSENIFVRYKSTTSAQPVPAFETSTESTGNNRKQQQVIVYLIKFYFVKFISNANAYFR